MVESLGPLGALIRGHFLFANLTHSLFTHAQVVASAFWSLVSRLTSLMSKPGECHTNLHSDLHVEHCNKAFKEGLKNVAGNFVLEVSQPCVMECSIRELWRQPGAAAGSGPQPAEVPGA